MSTENVLRRLDALENAVDRLHEKEAIAAQLKDLCSFLDTDSWTHFAKEEEALFPELEEFIPRDAGPVGVMLMEHEDLRKTNAEFQGAIAECFGGSDSLQTRTVIQNHGTHFVTVLRDHINKEEGTEEGSMARTARTNSVLTVREGACFLNIHANTVRRWNDQGILKSFRIGPRGDRRFRREDVLAFLPPEDRRRHRV